MDYYKFKMIYSVLAVLIVLISGCAPMQITEESNVLYDQGIISKQSIQGKDLEINKLKELLDDQQRQLRELSDQLNECRSKK